MKMRPEFATLAAQIRHRRGFAVMTSRSSVLLSGLRRARSRLLGIPRVGVVVLATLAGAFFALVSASPAAAIPGGDITEVCTGEISPDGTTFTLTADCGPVETRTHGSTRHHDRQWRRLHHQRHGPGGRPAAEWNGGIVTNETAGQTMNIQNVTIAGPEDGFVVSTEQPTTWSMGSSSTMRAAR